MKKLILPFFTFYFLLLTSAPAQTTPLVVDIDANIQTIPVKITCDSSEDQGLLNRAFDSHGAYRRVASGHQYEFRFARAAANSASVTILNKTGASTFTQTLNGNSTSNALLKAADAAVLATAKTPGFFASRLTFIGERTGKTEVYEGNLFFTEVRQLTNDKAQCLTPRWSPDGKRIIYTTYFRSGFPDIYIINLEQQNRESFFGPRPPAGTSTGAHFSPDGSKVAMVLSARGNPDVYTSDSNGKNLSPKTNTPHVVEASPCWSPDGSKILYVADATGGPQLYLVPSAGGSSQRLPTNVSRYCAEPDWSTGNPSRIAFTLAQNKSYQIGVFDISKRQMVGQITKAPFDAINPSWLADGRHLVYTERAANKRALYLWDSESGRRTRLSPDSFGSSSEAHVLPPR